MRELEQVAVVLFFDDGEWYTVRRVVRTIRNIIYPRGQAPKSDPEIVRDLVLGLVMLWLSGSQLGKRTIEEIGKMLYYYRYYSQLDD